MIKVINILPVAVRNEFELENNIASRYVEFYQNICFESEAWVLSACKSKGNRSNSIIFKALGAHPNKSFSLGMLVKCIRCSKFLFHIHGYNSIQARALIIILLILRRNFIVNYHGAYFLEDDATSRSLVKRLFSLLLMKNKKHIQFVCINTAQERFHTRMKHRCVFLPMPLNEIFLDGDLDGLQSTHRIYDATYVGRASKDKGFEDLLRVFLSYPENSYRFCIVLSCDQKQEEAIRRLLSRASNITLHTNANPELVMNLLSKSKVLCLNSPSEGLPRVLLEGLSVGCDFIAVKNRGTVTINEHFNHGVLVENIDCRNLKHSIEHYTLPKLCIINEKLNIFRRSHFLDGLFHLVTSIKQK